jgi:hypothetical protein
MEKINATEETMPLSRIANAFILDRDFTTGHF